MTDATDRLAELAKELLDQTLVGKVPWRETDSPSDFLYVGESAMVQISRSGDQDGHRLSLLNLDGDEIESISEFTWSEGQWRATDLQGVLSSLYDAARRVARNIDGIVDSLLDELRSDAPLPRRAPQPESTPPAATYGYDEEPF